MKGIQANAEDAVLVGSNPTITPNVAGTASPLPSHSVKQKRHLEESRSIGEWGGSSFVGACVSENGSHIRSPNLKNKK